MKRPLQLPLAITLALCGTNALALGLGPVQVKSRLNQPLDAEIPVIQGTAGEAEGLLVNLAGDEDFERIGLSRSRLGVPLTFAVAKGARGDLVIKVTSTEPVRSPYLDFLVEANWPKGRLLREYTVLLDPPLTAPATHTASAPAVTASPGTVTLTKREKPVARIADSTPAPAPKAKPVPAAAPAAPEHKLAQGEYGPVEAGETLSAIARAAQAGERGNINQMMLALLKNNPNAFYKDNINALKRGAILRIPSADEIKAVGTASEAAAQVHAQVEDWRGGRASPTLVADSAAAPTTAPTASKPTKAAKTTAKADGGERLELVPPKAGKDSLAMNDRPGAGAGSAAAGATTELKSELSRAKEALTARDQETGELKSRVKELEDLKGKNDRLISLKDSEIAELQQKLKQLQSQSNPAAAKAATTTAATTSAATTPSATAALPASAPVAATATPPSSHAEGAKIDKQDIWGNASSAPASTKPAEAEKTLATPAPVATVSPAPSGSVATTTPLAPTPATSNATTTPATTPAAEAPKPVAKPATPSAKPAVKPQPMAALPWYQEAWVKSAALAAGILLLLLGLLGLRKRKAPEATRGSIAGAFGDSPLSSPDGAHSAATEEAKLRAELQHDPGNVGLHLELLSLYYAERDVGRFEDAAAEMQAHVVDPHQPEWLEAQAMGQELAPHNPLFVHANSYDDAVVDAHAETVERPAFDQHAHFPGHDEDAEHDAFAASLREDAAHVPPAANVHADDASDFDFGFEPAIADNAAHTPAPASHVGNGFDFDTLPPLEDFNVAATPTVHVPALEVAESEPAPLRASHEEYFDDDAIGTKLDLAKAYMDMGDPEGARSMLDEVLAEGNDGQKSEARRLMSELG